ncbi:putative neuroblastoma breakpoint family member 5 [Equus caballus]|uniref:putative neuroblastoma breakpoint family member 5 n=1 Tax=Equus caballus TaxID=9796 RepID=UPI0038B3BE80
MAVSLGPVSDPGAEMTLLEVKQELQSQLEQSKQDFRDLKEKFLVSESTSYILANQLQKYTGEPLVMQDFQQVRVTLRIWAVRHGQSENDECGACKDIIESVLGEKLQFQEGKPTEKSTLVEKLKKYDVLIQDQAQELAQLRQTIEKGIELSVLLKQHLRNLLTHGDPTNFQGQGFQERLAEGCRLAERLARKLSPEIHEEEAEEQLGSLTPRKYHFLIHDHARKQTQIRQTSREGREVSVLLHQHLRDLLTHSDIGRNWGQGFREQLAEGCRLAERLVHKLSPENLEDDEDEEEQESLTPSLESELQKKEIVNEILQDPSGEQNLTPSSPHDLAASGEPLRSTAFPCDEPQVSLALEAATEYSYYKADKSKWSPS